MTPTAACRHLRTHPTPAEARLWQALQRRGLDGRKVRRQHSVGPYILDFYCPSERLAIEVDGPVHDAPGQVAYDARRSAYLEELGIRVLRLRNAQVLAALPEALDAIRAACSREPTPRRSRR